MRGEPSEERRYRKSHTELLAQYPLIEIMPRIEQHAHRDLVLHADVDSAHEADLIVIGHGGDWALVGLERLDADDGSVRQQRAAPAPGPERTHPCKRQHPRPDPDDQPL